MTTVWADVKAARGTEQVSADKQTGSTLYRIVVQRRAVPGGVAPDMRLLWKPTEEMNVREVLDADRADFTTFYAEAGVAT